MAPAFPKIIDAVVTTLERWTKPAMIGAGVVSLAWGLLLIPVAKRSLHLVTWLRHDATVYPSQVTSNRVLPLSYLGNPVRSARILSLRIQNRGNTPIGSSQELWTLSLTASTASHLVLIEDPKVNPVPLVIEQKQTENPRTLVLAFGVFDPRVTVDLELLLINAEESQPPLKVTPTLVGLPHEITVASPSNRLANRYFWHWAIPVLLLVAIPLLPPLAQEWYERKPVWKRILWTPVYIAVALLGLFVPAGLWVLLLSYIVAWFH